METNRCRLTLKYHTELWECAGAKGGWRATFILTLAVQIKCQMRGDACC